MCSLNLHTCFLSLYLASHLLKLLVNLSALNCDYIDFPPHDYIDFPPRVFWRSMRPPYSRCSVHIRRPSLQRRKNKGLWAVVTMRLDWYWKSIRMCVCESVNPCLETTRDRTLTLLFRWFSPSILRTLRTWNSRLSLIEHLTQWAFVNMLWSGIVSFLPIFWPDVAIGKDFQCL